MNSRNNRLLVKADMGKAVYQDLNPATAGWNLLAFTARRLQKGENWTGTTGQNEYLIVVLGGNMKADTNQGNWITTNARRDVFSGLPHALYLPPATDFTITATGDYLDIACGRVPSDSEFPARLVTPEDVKAMGIEYRGGDNASRQINSILPPGSDCDKLVCCEVYTPSGNWSSFPAHKHDNRKTDPKTGCLLEADLEEIYFYKTDKPQGFAIQKIYNDDRSLDELVEAHNNDIVLVPEGYHPVIAGHGYNVYYLNFLAGSDQSLAASNDPDHGWIFGTWRGMDPRIPLVTIDMNDKKNKIDN